MISSIQNPNCDGSHCESEIGDMRVLPLGGDGNLILCKSCYKHELAYRKNRNRELAKENRFDLPEWKNLKIYRNK